MMKMGLMRRTAVGALLVSGLVLAGCSEPATPADPSATLQTIADDFVEMRFEHSPESWYFGLSDLHAPDHAALSSVAPEALRAQEADEDALLERLQALDPDALSDRADWVVYVSLMEDLEASVGVRVCRRELWSLNHMFGWQTAMPRIAQLAPVETEAERAAALTRWSQIPRLIAEDRANLETGLSQGYSAPKSVVDRVVAQLDGLMAGGAESSPFYAQAGRTEDIDFQVELARIIEEEINPAIADHREWLAGAYRTAARDSLALSSLPEGEACYHAYLRNYTSLPRTAQETFDLGSATVAANREAVIDRGSAQYGTDVFEEILAANNAAPGNHFDSEDALIAYSREVVAHARDATEPLFEALPEQPMVVEPIPDFLRGTGQSSSYQSALPEDGPGTYRIASDRWETETRGGSEITAAHEGWPGHHMQIATAHQLDGLHPAVRLARVTAYTEGWARYSEALAEEAGVYSDAGYAQITRRAWPARGMVVDPGIHMMDWSREEALAFLRESGRFAGPSGDAMLDRIAVIPGQLTAYDTGGLEIFALRAEAEARLGDRFDIRAFHTAILENGALPLAALREKVEAWIETVEAESE